MVPHGPEEAPQCGRHVHYGSHVESLAHGLLSATDALRVFFQADNWACGTCISNNAVERTGHSVRFLSGASQCTVARRSPLALVRQAQLGVSCRVQVPAEEGLTNHSYRVLRL